MIIDDTTIWAEYKLLGELSNKRPLEKYEETFIKDFNYWDNVDCSEYGLCLIWAKYLIGVANTKGDGVSINNMFDINKKYYHVSVKKDLKYISHKNSESFCKYNKYGNFDCYANLEKVCFSESIYGCVQALCLPGWSQNYQLYFGNRMGHTEECRNPYDKTEYILYLYQLDFRYSNLNNIVDTTNTPYKVFDEVLTGEISYSFNNSNIKKFNNDHKIGIPCTFVTEINVNMLPRHLCMFKEKFTTTTETFNKETNNLSGIYILDFEINSDNIYKLLKKDKKDFLRNNVVNYINLCRTNLNRQNDFINGVYNDMHDKIKERCNERG